MDHRELEKRAELFKFRTGPIQIHSKWARPDGKWRLRLYNLGCLEATYMAFKLVCQVLYAYSKCFSNKTDEKTAYLFCKGQVYLYPNLILFIVNTSANLVISEKLSSPFMKLWC